MANPLRTLIEAICLTLAACLLSGCNIFGGGGGDSSNKPNVSPDFGPPIHLRTLELSDPIRLSGGPGPVMLAAAQNEAIYFGVEITPPGLATPTGLRLNPFHQIAGDAQIDASRFRAYQLVAMPVDLNKAAFVRHTGLTTSARFLPRALLPVKMTNGVIDLTSLRDPEHPLDPRGRAGPSQSVMLWIDLNIPSTAKPGDYESSCDLGAERLSIHLHVHDFLIPDQRHLQMVGNLDWNAMVRLWQPQFEMVTPYLLSRESPQYATTMRTLDALVKLGQANRLQVVVPEFQPQVKWPAAEPPQVSWQDFDSVISPYLKGDAFADRVPLGFWPLPAAEEVERYDLASQIQYWNAAASHFDQLDWLKSAPMRLNRPSAAQDDIAENFRLSERAARLLEAYPRMKIMVPMEDDELGLKSDSHPTFIDTTTLNRVITAAPGLVYRTHLGNWPAGLGHPAHWLRTDIPGLVPYAGAGSAESDIRLWAFLAYLRQAQIIQWGSPLPNASNPQEPADPSEVIWFYPGQWFGLDQPVPTVQLKWLRQAEQDYEYLLLAWERQENIKALVMARLITKPVQIDPLVEPDPIYSLMSGTADPKAWVAVRDLLAQAILLHAPGQDATLDQDTDFNGRLVHWMEPQEKPLMLGRTVQWGWSIQLAKKGTQWVDVRVALDVYNAADQRLAGQLNWAMAPPAWEFNPRPINIGLDKAVNVFNVARFSMDAAVNLDDVSDQSRQPVELTFINEQSPGRPYHLRMVLPVALSQRREGQPLEIDGNLSEWNDADALQDGPMVKMFDRPMIQNQELELAATKSRVFSTWNPRNFFLAFRVEGVSSDALRATTNYPVYQSRRVWGEDLCEALIQPVYADNMLGPVTHLVFKPHGQLFVESKLDRRVSAVQWRTVEGADVRYAAAPVANGVWKGELAIPWSLLNDAKHQGERPTLLRFNFAQHKTSTGESASWAGPIDFGRDETFMGLLGLR